MWLKIKLLPNIIGAKLCIKTVQKEMFDIYISEWMKIAHLHMHETVHKELLHTCVDEIGNRHKLQT